ncbi:MAG: RIP metalloprotease RseP [Bacilli bacterium]
MNLLYLLYFVLILGITIFVHELGHFIFAKKSKIYVYEFSIGMGPKIFKFNRKNDETTYCIGLIPLGGYVKMSGEEINEDKKIPKNRRLQSKTWGQKFIVMVAGCMFNFVFAFLILFAIGLFYGSNSTEPKIDSVMEGFPALASGVEQGDLILKIDGQKMTTYDDVLLKLEVSKDKKDLVFEVLKANGTKKTYQIKPVKMEIDNITSYKIGVNFSITKNYGFINAITSSFEKMFSIIKSMFIIIFSLITGALGINSLAGPVGIYGIVGDSAQAGIDSVLYLIAFLSINVGFVNLLPFPAFDGGKVLFLFIEKIRKKPVSSQVENIIHTVGFVFLMVLMLVITFQYIQRLF